MNSNENLAFEVRLLNQARNYFKRAEPAARVRAAEAIDAIRQNPTHGLHIKPLRGLDEGYRYRLGNIRIIYTVKNNDRLIIISIIAPRGDAYKK